MNGTATATCPACGGTLTLGESRVWIRPDRRLAHVKCEPLPRPARRSRRTARQTAPVPVSRPAAPAPDERPVLVMWRRSDPFRYEVTDDTGAVLWSGPSATALSKWKRTRTDVQLVNAASVYEAVRGLAGRIGLLTVPAQGNVKATSKRRTRRSTREH